MSVQLLPRDCTRDPYLQVRQPVLTFGPLALVRLTVVHVLPDLSIMSMDFHCSVGFLGVVGEELVEVEGSSWMASDESYREANLLVKAVVEESSSRRGFNTSKEKAHAPRKTITAVVTEK